MVSDPLPACYRALFSAPPLWEAGARREASACGKQDVLVSGSPAPREPRGAVVVEASPPAPVTMEEGEGPARVAREDVCAPRKTPPLSPPLLLPPSSVSSSSVALSGTEVA